ncbi:hypothetical protein GCM10022214_38300 [Actinomadura miaoliensis]|uniref:Uncharacterized protein n=1 Tax=Actinomadura miaoliensis TaxID=430685 RepID=A0ABP7VYN1_9ACTN
MLHATQVSPHELGRVVKVSYPHERGGQGDGALVGAGGLAIAGGDAAPLLEPFEAAFDDVMQPVDALVEDGRAACAPSFAQPVADLIGAFGDGGADRARAARRG